MATIQTGIELNDYFTVVLNSIMSSVNLTIQAMEGMQETMNAGIDTSALESAREEIDRAAAAADRLGEALAGSGAPAAGAENAAPVILPVEVSSPDPLIDQPPPVEVPVVWHSDNLEVFTNTGVERFEMEVQSANTMLNTLNNTQARIAARAARTNIFPPGMITDMNGMQTRLQEIQLRIQAIESNPLNMGTDTANAELEQLRAQLNQAVQEQEQMNRAVEEMDVQGANEAYLRLSQIVGNTERHIRDNVDEQGRFRREIEESTHSAADLKKMIAGAVGAFAGMAGLRKAKTWIEDCTAAFDTQLNAEMQLISVLANMLEGDYTAQFEVDAAADTTAVHNEIDAIQNGVDEVIVPVTAETSALTAAYDQITAKASEIQGRGIYGDEAMIAAAAEFSTYFTDTDAIEMMMDTLSNYAMGMTGGGAVDSAGMVNYATNLGKIMSGSYDAMTKKGFEFTDAQKAIIEGEATREQIAAVLGEEYADMSADMQAAAAITQVIDEAWAGLYESMSNTPEGKIIQMTNTWGDMKEVVGGQLYPYVLLFVDVITENWATIQAVLDGITVGLQYMLGFMSWLLEGAVSFAQVVIDNWSWISPIVYGAAGALAVYYGWQLLCKIATAAMSAAQAVLNAVMSANPVMIVVLAIIALIAVFYAAVEAVNHFAGTSISATGIICGVFMVAAAFIGNLFVTLINFVIDIFVVLWNFIAAFANFFASVFTDPVGAVARLFFDLVDCVLGLLESLASAIDTIFGSNLAGAVSGWRDSLGSWVDETFGQGEEIMAKLDASSLHLERFEYGAAWDAGYAFGEGIDESIANFDPSSLFGTADVPSAVDYAGALTTGGTESSIADVAEEIAEDTGAISDALGITQEDLKYLRDIAEQDHINRFTTAEIKIEQTNNNNISSDMDLDGIVAYLEDAVDEAAAYAAEGVHI